MTASDITATLCRVKIASAFVRELRHVHDGDRARAERTLDHLAVVERDLVAMRDAKLAAETKPVRVRFPVGTNVVALPTHVA